MTTKKRLLTATAALGLVLGTGLALRPSGHTKATETPPIVAQVENHEQRIGDLETKTDATQTQVNQNTADIQQVQTGTGIKPAPTVETVYTPVAQPTATTTTQTTTAEPTPEPQPDPHTVTNLKYVYTAAGERDNKYNRFLCVYTFYDGTIGWAAWSTPYIQELGTENCTRNYRANVGEVMSDLFYNQLRFDPAPEY